MYTRISAFRDWIESTMARQGGATYCAGGHWAALVISPLGARSPLSLDEFQPINKKGLKKKQFNFICRLKLYCLTNHMAHDCSTQASSQVAGGEQDCHLAGHRCGGDTAVECGVATTATPLGFYE